MHKNKTITIILLLSVIIISGFTANASNLCKEKEETNENTGQIYVYSYWEGSSVSIPKPLPRVNVNVESTDNTITKNKITNILGECTIKNLPLDKTYNVKISKTGYREVNKQVTLTQNHDSHEYNVRMYQKTKSKQITNLLMIRQIIQTLFPKLKTL